MITYLQDETSVDHKSRQMFVHIRTRTPDKIQNADSLHLKRLTKT